MDSMQGKLQPPLITANFVLSADGKITTRGQHSSGFGSVADSYRLLYLRAKADAVLVGRKTLMADSMSLGLGSDAEYWIAHRRERKLTDYPARCVATLSREISLDHPLFHSPGGPIHIFHGPHFTPTLPEDCSTHQLDSAHNLLPALLALAAEQNWRHIHCEGGPTLLRYLLQQQVLDKLHITITPRLFGGHSAPTLCGSSPTLPFPQSIHFTLQNIFSEDGDLFLTYHKKSPCETRAVAFKS